MQQEYTLIVVIPVGPNTRPEFIADTIDSIYFYCNCNLKIIISDDSQQGLGALLQVKYPDIDLYVTKKPGGLAGGLYITLAHTYKYIIEKYKFKTLLKIDSDALVIGANPQKVAEKMFEVHPNIGIAGLHKTRTVAYSFNTSLDNKWPRNHIMRATCTWRFIKRPIGNFVLRKYFFKALANGYELGENVFGGAYFMSELLLQKLNQAKFLPIKNLKNSRLEEDHIFSMLAKVVNMDLGDLASGSLPFGCAHKTLPASPETLYQAGKKIIHSTRAWEDMREQEIRQYFKTIRNAERVAGQL